MKKLLLLLLLVAGAAQAQVPVTANPDHEAMLRHADPKLAANPLLFPSEEIRKGFHPYPNLTPADEREMEERMAQVTGA